MKTQHTVANVVVENQNYNEIMSLRDMNILVKDNTISLKSQKKKLNSEVNESINSVVNISYDTYYQKENIFETKDFQNQEVGEIQKMKMTFGDNAQDVIIKLDNVKSYNEILSTRDNTVNSIYDDTNSIKSKSDDSENSLIRFSKRYNIKQQSDETFKLKPFEDSSVSYDWSLQNSGYHKDHSFDSSIDNASNLRAGSKIFFNFNNIDEDSTTDQLKFTNEFSSTNVLNNNLKCNTKNPFSDNKNNQENLLNNRSVHTELSQEIYELRSNIIKKSQSIQNLLNLSKNPSKNYQTKSIDLLNSTNNNHIQEIHEKYSDKSIRDEQDIIKVKTHSNLEQELNNISISSSFNYNGDRSGPKKIHSYINNSNRKIIEVTNENGNLINKIKLYKPKNLKRKNIDENELLQKIFKKQENFVTSKNKHEDDSVNSSVYSIHPKDFIQGKNMMSMKFGNSMMDTQNKKNDMHNNIKEELDPFEKPLADPIYNFHKCGVSELTNSNMSEYLQSSTNSLDLDDLLLPKCTANNKKQESYKIKVKNLESMTPNKSAQQEDAQIIFMELLKQLKLDNIFYQDNMDSLKSIQQFSFKCNNQEQGEELKIHTRSNTLSTQDSMEEHQKQFAYNNHEEGLKLTFYNQDSLIIGDTLFSFSQD